MLSGCLRSPARHQFGNYSNAEKYYAEGKYDKAIDSYRKYIDEHPEGNLAVIAEYYIAKSYAALNKDVEARTGFEAISNKYPDLIWAELSKEQLKELE
jgi:TolA-binding protein